MVIAYPSCAEGAVLHLFTVTPRILCWRTGSVYPSIVVGVTITTSLAFVATYWNPLRNLPEDAKPLDAYNTMGFLIAFLLVFKTQSAYNQYWTAITHVEQLMVIYREMGMGACTTFNWDHDPEVKQFARKLMRLIVLHFHVVVEYFRRTGGNAARDSPMQNKLRDNIRRLAGSREYEILYPNEKDMPGSESQHEHTHPIILVAWMDLVMARCFKHGGCLSPPHAASFSALTKHLMEHFQGMNQIDKTQFPLPYAQLVKLLVTVWVLSLPFVLERSCAGFTPFAAFLVSLAVFGLDQVAEILESPFGTDPNDIDLESLESDLVNDLEFMYYGLTMRMDVVFSDENDLQLRGEIRQSEYVKAISTRSRLDLPDLPERNHSGASSTTLDDGRSAKHGNMSGSVRSAGHRISIFSGFGRKPSDASSPCLHESTPFGRSAHVESLIELGLGGLEGGAAPHRMMSGLSSKSLDSMNSSADLLEADGEPSSCLHPSDADGEPSSCLHPSDADGEPSSCLHPSDADGEPSSYLHPSDAVPKAFSPPAHSESSASVSAASRQIQFSSPRTLHPLSNNDLPGATLAIS